MDFDYGTYPLMLKDGGVCSTCSHLGRRTNITFGVPARRPGSRGTPATLPTTTQKKTATPSSWRNPRAPSSMAPPSWAATSSPNGGSSRPPSR